MGLSGMIDPIRPEVKEAIDQCRSAGIRPIMITEITGIQQQPLQGSWEILAGESEGCYRR